MKKYLIIAKVDGINYRAEPTHYTSKKKATARLEQWQKAMPTVQYELKEV